MIEIICRGKSPNEAKAKCMIVEILLTEKILTNDMTINVLNAIGGIYVVKSEE